jgi:threonine synthase
VSFNDALLSGLAADGGLYVPEHYPRVSPEQLNAWRDLLQTQGYGALASQVLELFADGYPPDSIGQMTRQAYTAEKFGDPAIVPLQPIGQTSFWLAHLSNGPTASFKDIAMQLLGELLSYELDQRDTTMTVIGATSGDTGSSAEHALMGRRRIKVVMLLPYKRVTPFQRAQMLTIDDPAITNLEIEGVFDDCQDLVKAINLDTAFKARFHISAVNSINWGRVAAQVVYYFAAYLRSGHETVSFAVPTGNFGNILAGHVAREMGLPIDNLILATNENNVLDEFFRNGIYRPRQADLVHRTSSPSMDISKASNFERFVADLLRRDGARVAELFGPTLAQQGYFDLSWTPQFAGLRERFGFISGSASHADRLAVIRRWWQDYQILIDPHTANAVHVAETFTIDGPVIVLETALPFKFADAIEQATGFKPPLPARFAGLEQATEQSVIMPNDLTKVKRWIAKWLRLN